MGAILKDPKSDSKVLSVDRAVDLVVTQIKQNTNYKKSHREEIQTSGTFSQEMNQ